MSANPNILCRVQDKRSMEYLGNAGYQRYTSEKGEFYNSVAVANSALNSSIKMSKSNEKRKSWYSDSAIDRLEHDNLNNFVIVEYELRPVAYHAPYENSKAKKSKQSLMLEDICDKLTKKSGKRFRELLLKTRPEIIEIHSTVSNLPQVAKMERQRLAEKDELIKDIIASEF